MIRYLIWMAILLGSTAISQAQTTGDLQGVIMEKEMDEPVIGANVVLIKEGLEVYQTQTDIGGNYNFSNVDVGEYDLAVLYTGYPTHTEKGVYIGPGQIKRVNMTIASVVVIGGVTVNAENDPFLDDLCCAPAPDNVISKETIAKAPELDTRAIAASTAMVNVTDVGEELDGLGRPSGNIVYVDNIPTSIESINPLDIESISVITTGVPARYGNSTGFITNIITKGPSRTFRGGVMAETSQFLDNFGENRVNIYLSGPLITKKMYNDVDGKVLIGNDGKEKRRPVLGYRFSGTYFTTLDNRPSALGTFRLNENKRQEILANPLVENSSGSGFVPATDFLTEEDLEQTNVRSNARSSFGQYAAKLDYKPTDEIFVSVGSQGQFNWGTNASIANQLLNYDYNPIQRSSVWSISGRMRHTIASTKPGNEADGKEQIHNAFQNFSYELQGDYTETNFSTADPRHGDRFWDYGYVGKFHESRRPVIGAVDSVAIVNTNQDTIGWNVNLGHQAFYNSFDEYEGNFNINPGLAAYNQHIGQPLGFDGFGGTDGNRPGSINEMEMVNGLNTSGRATVDGLFNAPHLNGSRYQKRQTSQIRANVTTYFDLVMNQKSGNPIRHKIELGGLFEQRIERSYSMNPFSLWNLAYQSTNAHISNATDVTKPTGEIYYDPTTQRQYGLYEALIRSDEEGNEVAMTTFGANLRQAMGYDKKDWVNVHEMTPDQMELSWFAPTTLITGRQRVLSYYGYDYLGNRTATNTTFNEFFTATDAAGNKTRPIAPNKPIYTAGYIQDQFTYKDIICRFGVRVDNYDANTSVMKDPYSVTGYETAAEFESTDSRYEAGQSIEYNRPTNIGDDYAVYVSSNNSDARVIGYRDNDQWYNAQGLPVNTPSALGANFVPALKGFGTAQVDPQGNEYRPQDAFEDYSPTLVVMPRISFAFPITKTSSFYASYDVLAQRPPVGAFATPYDYYNFREITSGGGVINNPNLRPERTVNYEVGYRQALGKNAKMKVSLLYREDRDMIQLRQYINAYPTTYTTYGNDDFATMKAFTLEYETRRVKNFKIRANYVLQFAEGTGSNPTSSAGVAARELKNVFAVDSDQRHTFYALLDYRFGSGEKYNGPKIGRVDVLENAGLSMTVNANSGRPYTRKAIPGGIGTSFPNRITEGSINGARMPWNVRVSLRLDKDFVIGKKSKNPLMVNVYIRIQNLFNTQNVLNVYSTTGSPVDDGFLTAANSPGVSYAATQADSYELLYSLRANNPYNISRPRRIFLGASVRF